MVLNVSTRCDSNAIAGNVRSMLCKYVWFPCKQNNALMDVYALCDREALTGVQVGVGIAAVNC